jgi:undecaprenyl-diphosphatase
MTQSLPARSGRHPLLAVLLAASLCAFAAVAWDLLRGGPLTGLDLPISQWLHGQVSPWLTAGLLVLTHVHGTTGMCVLAALAAAALAWRRQPAWALRFGLGVPLAMLLNNMAIKPLFARPRPQFDAPLLSLQTWSFPSGHVLAATVFYGLLCALALEHAPGRPGHARALLAAAAVVVILVGFSRVYLGVHYLSDALAAVAEGLALVSALLLARSPVARTTAGSSG